MAAQWFCKPPVPGSSPGVGSVRFSEQSARSLANGRASERHKPHVFCGRMADTYSTKGEAGSRPSHTVESRPVPSRGPLDRQGRSLPASESYQLADGRRGLRYRAQPGLQPRAPDPESFLARTPGREDAVERLRERRIQAHICAPITLHLNRRKACALGDEHDGCCPGTCKRSAQLALSY